MGADALTLRAVPEGMDDVLVRARTASMKETAARWTAATAAREDLQLAVVDIDSMRVAMDLCLERGTLNDVDTLVLLISMRGYRPTLEVVTLIVLGHLRLELFEEVTDHG